MARAFFFATHLCRSVLAYLTLRSRSQGGFVVFTHFQDIDGDGRDRQMGPLVDEILARKEPLAEITLIPFRSGAYPRNRGIKKRPCISHGVILGLARLVAPGSTGERLARARARVARGVLRGLSPRAVFVIDESGSGQPYVRACRDLGIPVLGIQHGDFQPENRQYALSRFPRGPGEAEIVPVDRLCLWSEWFRTRLLRVSTIYTRENTVITGRLRHAKRDGVPVRRPAERTVVVFLGEADPRADEEAHPFLEALRGDSSIELRVRPHPARTPEPAAPTRSLEDDLREAHVAVGFGSSALLEALYHETPIVCLLSGDLDDPAGYVHDGVAQACRAPEEVAGLCGRLARKSGPGRAARAVWGEGQENPAAKVLDSIPGPGRS